MPSIPRPTRWCRRSRGSKPLHGIAPSPDGARIYASNEADSTLDVFDRASGTLIKKVPLSNHPNNIAVAKDGGRIFVAIARAPGAVDVIDAKTLTLDKSIPVNGRLHNIYVTPDGKHLIAGSIPAKLMTVIDLDNARCRYGSSPSTSAFGPWQSRRSRRRDQARLRAALEHQWFRRGGFRGAQGSGAHHAAARPRPSSRRMRSARPRRPMASASRRTTRPCGSPVSSNNAVFVYSLADLSLIGEVALPSLKLPGHGAIAAVPNWVTFTPDGRHDLHLERGTALGHRHRHASDEGQGRHPGGRSAQAHQHPGAELNKTYIQARNLNLTFRPPNRGPVRALQRFRDRCPGRRVPLDRRTFRLRQEHVSQRPSRPAASGFGRADRQRQADLRSRHRPRHGVPGVRAAALAHGAGQRRAWARAQAPARRCAARDLPAAHRDGGSRRASKGITRTSSRAA